MTTSSTEPAHIGPVHIDQKIVQEVLSAATGDTIAKKQTHHMQNWCKFIVQSPDHKGGYVITQTTASGLAAFYSATAKFVTLLTSLPHGASWVRGGQDLMVYDTWSNSKLQALIRPIPALFRTTNAQNCVCKTPRSSCSRSRSGA
jgi:hypothetical protein